MSEDYQYVATGKLKLKKKGLATVDPSHKKSKKKKHALDKLLENSNDKKDENIPDPKLAVKQTYSEKRFEEAHKKVILREAKKMSQTSLKDKLDKMNQQLDKLTEFYDVPRVNSANIG